MSKNCKHYSQDDINCFMQYPSIFKSVRPDRVSFNIEFRKAVWEASNGSPNPNHIREQLLAITGSTNVAQRLGFQTIDNLAKHIRRDGKPKNGSSSIIDVRACMKADSEYDQWLLENGFLKLAKNGRCSFTDKLRLIVLERTESLTAEQALKQAGIDLSRFGYQRLRTLIKETEGVKTIRTSEKLTDNDLTELKCSPFISSVTPGQIRYRKCFDIWSEKLRSDLTAHKILELFGLDPNKLSATALVRLTQRIKYHNLNVEITSDLSDLPGDDEFKLRFLNQYYLILKSRLDKEFELTRSLWPVMKCDEKHQVCQMIQAGTRQEDGFSLSSLLEVSGIPRSSWYRHINSASKPAQTTKREQKDKEDLEEIRKIVDYKGFKKGSRQIRLQFQNATGRTISLTRLRRLMKENGLECNVRSKSTSAAAKKKMIKENTKPNLLRRRFRLNKPGEVFLTDVSYLDYGSDLENRAYLSAIKDPSSGRIQAVLVSDSQDSTLGEATVEQLPKSESDSESAPLFHSDQGVLYLNPTFQAMLASKGYEQSMSRRGNCWDNSSMESFFGHFKDECPYAKCQNIEELRQLVNEYVVYYNTQRPQPCRNNMTPDEFEKYLCGMTEEQWKDYLQTENAKYNKMLEKAAESAIERARIDKAVAGDSEYGQKKRKEIEIPKTNRHLQDDA